MALFSMIAHYATGADTNDNTNNNNDNNSIRQATTTTTTAAAVAAAVTGNPQDVDNDNINTFVTILTGDDDGRDNNNNNTIMDDAVRHHVHDDDDIEQQHQQHQHHHPRRQQPQWRYPIDHNVVIDEYDDNAINDENDDNNDDNDEEEEEDDDNMEMTSLLNRVPHSSSPAATTRRHNKHGNSSRLKRQQQQPLIYDNDKYDKQRQNQNQQQQSQQQPQQSQTQSQNRILSTLLLSGAAASTNNLDGDEMIITNKAQHHQHHDSSSSSNALLMNVDGTPILSTTTTSPINSSSSSGTFTGCITRWLTCCCCSCWHIFWSPCGYKSTLQCMNVMARIVLWCTVLALVVAVIWYSYELHNHGTDPHLIAWFSAGAFVLLGFPVSMWGIVGHLANYNQPNVQVYIVRILWMVPFYSIESWLAMRFHNQAIYIETLRDFYESYVLYSFLQFLIEVLGGEENLVLMLKDKSPTRGVHMWGLQWCVKPWLMGQPVRRQSIRTITSNNNHDGSFADNNINIGSMNKDVIGSEGRDDTSDEGSAEILTTAAAATGTAATSAIATPGGGGGGVGSASMMASTARTRTNQRRPRQQRPLKRIYWKSPFFIKCKFGVLQYVILKFLCAIAVLLLEFKGWYHEGHFDWRSGYLYICILTNVSQCWALYCLIFFYYATKTELSPIRPVGKFLSVKALVFFTWWQSVFISVLYQMDMIPNYTEDWSSEDVAKGIQDYFICVEMFLAAVIHIFVFPHNEYTPAAVEARIRAFNSKSSSTNFYGNDHLHQGRKRLGRHKLHSHSYYTKNWKENNSYYSSHGSGGGADDTSSKNSNLTTEMKTYNYNNNNSATSAMMLVEEGDDHGDGVALDSTSFRSRVISQDSMMKNNPTASILWNDPLALSPPHQAVQPELTEIGITSSENQRKNLIPQKQQHIHGQLGKTYSSSANTRRPTTPRRTHSSPDDRRPGVKRTPSSDSAEISPLNDVPNITSADILQPKSEPLHVMTANSQQQKIFDSWDRHQPTQTDALALDLNPNQRYHDPMHFSKHSTAEYHDHGADDVGVEYVDIDEEDDYDDGDDSNYKQHEHIMMSSSQTRYSDNPLGSSMSSLGGTAAATSSTNYETKKAQSSLPIPTAKPGFVRALLDSAIPRDLRDNTVGIVTGEYHVEKKTLLHHAATSDQYDLFSNRRRALSNNNASAYSNKTARDNNNNII